MAFEAGSLPSYDSIRNSGMKADQSHVILHSLFIVDAFESSQGCYVIKLLVDDDNYSDLISKTFF